MNKIPQLNKFQEESLLELGKGKSHIQVAKDLNRSTAIVKYHQEKFFKLGLLEITKLGFKQRTSLDYQIVDDGKLIGNHWRAFSLKGVNK